MTAEGAEISGESLQNRCSAVKESLTAGTIVK
jgi:hypothetical protein